jgi:hypothetical protein
MRKTLLCTLAFLALITSAMPATATIVGIEETVAPKPQICLSLRETLRRLNRSLTIDGSDVEDLEPILSDMGVTEFTASFGREEVTVDVRVTGSNVTISSSDGQFTITVDRTTCEKVVVWWAE